MRELLVCLILFFSQANGCMPSDTEGTHTAYSIGIVENPLFVDMESYDNPEKKGPEG